MVFDAPTLVWRCPEQDCAQIALPRHEVEEGKGKPVVGEGSIELVRVKTRRGPHYLLRATENNVVIDITKHMVSAVDNPNGYDLRLMFRDAVEVDEE